MSISLTNLTLTQKFILSLHMLTRLVTLIIIKIKEFFGRHYEKGPLGAFIGTPIMKGENQCQWLLLSSTELCGGNCIKKDCKAPEGQQYNALHVMREGRS